MLTASDLHIDFIADILPLVSMESPLMEFVAFIELPLLADIAALLAALSIVYVLVFVLTMTLGSPGEQTAFVVLAFAEPFFIPVDWASAGEVATEAATAITQIVDSRRINFAF